MSGAVGRSARAAACGKVILLGEHAVVYGVPALAAGIDRGARAEATLLDPAAGGASVLHLGGRAITADAGAEDGLARAFAELLGPGAPPVSVTASSDLPPGGGLGSSAALGVAIARAVEALSAPGSAAPGSVEGAPASSVASAPRDSGGAGGAESAPTDSVESAPRDSGGAGGAGTGGEEAEARALARALSWERVFHGNPSGIDSYAAAHGGAFRFVRGQPAAPLRPAVDLWLCVGLSGAGASTRAMVEGLARLFERKPDVKRQSIEAIDALVRNAALAIEAGDLVGLGKLMDLDHMVLAGLFLSTEALERLCALARGAGALGAKLTGSGGGGAAIALVPGPGPDHPPDEPGPTASAVLDAWKAEGFEGFVTRIRAR